MYLFVRNTFFFLLYLSLVSGAVNGQEPTIYASGGFNDSNLYTVDPTTAVATVVGDMGQYVTGLAFHPTTGVLYGTTTPSKLGPNPRSLITIDPATGAVAVIGPHGLPSGGPIIDITFSSSGVLYGTDPIGGNLVTIDLTTGAGTVVGNYGYTDAYGFSLDFSPNGTLYLFGGGSGTPPTGVYTVNPSTGAATYAAPNLDPDDDYLTAGSHHPTTGILYTIDDDTPATLATIDTATGTYTPIGYSSVFLSGLAWTPGAQGSPSNLTARHVASAIHLNWQDNTSNEYGFEIQRKAGAGAYEILATVQNEVTHYEDRVQRGIVYTYRVRAILPTGTTGFSNEASASAGRDDDFKCGATGFEFFLLFSLLVFGKKLRRKLIEIS